MITQVRWKETSERVSRIVDGLGQPIDLGIRDVVIGLNVLGVQTLASCEGHLDHGVAAPWVDIGNPEAKPLARVAMRKMQEVDILRQSCVDPKQRQTAMVEAEEAKMQAKRLHLAERQKIIPCLDQFYQDRSVPYDCRLIINPGDWVGIGRLENQGSDLQCIRDPEEKIQKLVLYQQEMAAFAAFLKNALAEA